MGLVMGVRGRCLLLIEGVWFWFQGVWLEDEVWKLVLDENEKGASRVVWCIIMHLHVREYF